MFKLCVSLAALLAVAVAEPSYLSPTVLPHAYSAAHFPGAYPYAGLHSAYPYSSLPATYPGYVPSAAYPAASPYVAPYHTPITPYGAVPALPHYNSPLIWKKK